MKIRTAAMAVLAAVVLATTGCQTALEGQAVGPGQGKDTGTPQTSQKPLPKVPPSQIEGIKQKEFPGRGHVEAPERVDYEESPPFGGAHDQVWVPCNGAVYTKAVRSEHVIHSLEHGAVWIAYNPDQVDEAAVAALAEKVTGKPYTMLSPFPGLDHPVSVQAWGFQLKVDDPGDPRIDQFITALRENQESTPEPGASCDNVGNFDLNNPPPFDPEPPGPDAVPETFQG